MARRPAPQGRRLKLIGYLHSVARKPGARDGTRYGSSRFATKSFKTHHIGSISSAIVHADAASIEQRAADGAIDLTRPIALCASISGAAPKESQGRPGTLYFSTNALTPMLFNFFRFNESTVCWRSRRHVPTLEPLLQTLSCSPATGGRALGLRTQLFSAEGAVWVPLL